MTEDLSIHHQPIGGFFSMPVAPDQWASYRLTDEQIGFYEQNGYLSGIRVLSDEQVDLLRAELDEFFEPEHPG
jgi:hypothetical protein